MLKVWRTREGEDGRAAGAFQFERLTVKVTRWRVVLAGLGVGAYALGLVVLAPSEIVVPRSSNGERQAVGTMRKLGIVDLPKEMEALRKLMFKAAEELDFEKAAALRDRLRELEDVQLKLGGNDEVS
jgi:hypothetical protein